MSKIEHLLWVDLETTGSNERLDEIAEIGCILTDTKLNELWEFTTPVWVSEHRMKRLYENETVLSMHESSGLLEILEANARYEDNTLPPVWQVDMEVVTALDGMCVTPHRVILAGSGVSHFDRRFINEQMGSLAAYLGYPTLDIGVVRRAWEMFTGGDAPYNFDAADKTHRALDDIKLHLREARAFKEWWDYLIEVYER